MIFPWRLQCKCGHLRDAHQHYRSGTECSLCPDCPQWRPVRLTMSPAVNQQGKKVNAMTVPDALPVISKGSHISPAEGACIMEYISILAGETFTDHPACTHPALAAMARSVNDALPDSERHRLVPMIGRLLGTGPPGDAERDRLVNAALAVWCRRTCKAVAPPCGCASCRCRDELQAAVLAVSYVHTRDGGPDALVSLLSSFIDEYDRLTGRGPSPDMTGRVREVAAKVGASA